MPFSGLPKIQSLTCTEEFYEDPERAAFNDIQRLIVEDWARLEKDGFYVGSELVWPIVLGIKGDWSYLVPCLHYTVFFLVLGNYFHLDQLPTWGLHILQINSFIGDLAFCSGKVECGWLERSYRRGPKGAREGQDEKSMAGICHLCLAGHEGNDWEDVYLEGHVQSYLYIYTIYLYIYRCQIVFFYIWFHFYIYLPYNRCALITGLAVEELSCSP